MVANTVAAMSVEISISSVVKVYHHCPFKVKEGEVLSVSKKRGEHGNAFKVWSERGQLGHLQARKQILSAHFGHIKWIFARKYCTPRSKTACTIN